MRRYLGMIFVLSLLVSCRNISTPTGIPSQTAVSTSTALVSTVPPPSPTPVPLPTSTATAVIATNTATPIASTNSPPEPYTILFHPDDVLYVGDQVSIEVISPPGVDENKASVRVQIDPPEGPKLNGVDFGAWGIAGRSEASLIWAWDTRNFSPGDHTLAFYEAPHGYSWTQQVTLLPANAMPPDQAAAQWAETQTHCCTVYYVTDTASARDLPALTTLVDAQAQDAIQKMGATFTEPITITILPRQLGNGGFTSTEISVSYLDRNYASNDWALVVHHEMIHAIDGHLGGDFRPTLFVEGLAVYLTGGHYKPEPLMPRAAALLDGYLNLYIPLKPLADDFYSSQHEIGYLEGASLIEYMIKTYGEPAFFSFYRDIHNRKGESQSDSIDAALQAHFSVTFSQLELDFIAALKAEAGTAAWVADVRSVISYYDTMRRYQQLLDPSAYFRTAWLLDNKTMRARHIVADYLRHPHTPANLALETLLITAGQQMSVKDYQASSQTLDMVNTVLDSIEHGTPDPFSSSILASDYLAISTALDQKGYETQNIGLNGDVASAKVTTSAGPDLILLHLQRSGGQWSITP